MAGEHWATVKALVAGVDVDALYTAARDWYRIRSQMHAVSGTSLPPSMIFGPAGVVSVAAEELQRGALLAHESIERASDALYDQRSPAAVLMDVAGFVGLLQREMTEDEQGGVLDFGALPDASIPRTTVMQVARELVLHEFDQRAEVYLRRLHDRVAAAVADFDSQFTESWPAGLPQLDPETAAPAG